MSSVGNKLPENESLGSAGPSSFSTRDVNAASKLGYEILSVIGRGAMGVVYRARQLDLDKIVALKTIQSDRLDDATAADRFRREALAVARLQHPAIVQALQYGVVDNVRVLAMEYVDGQTGEEWVKRNGPMPMKAAWDVVRQTAGGLLHASRNGVLHRDIKPSNLMILPLPDGARFTDGVGIVKIADFGLALLDELKTTDQRLTGDGHLIGSPAYMAPERFDDEAPANILGDIYSLGVTLVTLRTGRHPFAKGSIARLVAQKSTNMSTNAPLLRLMLAGEAMLVVDMLKPETSQRVPNYETLIQRIDEMLADTGDKIVTNYPPRWDQDDLSSVSTSNRRVDQKDPIAHRETRAQNPSSVENPDNIETLASGASLVHRGTIASESNVFAIIGGYSNRQLIWLAGSILLLSLVAILAGGSLLRHVVWSPTIERTHTHPVGGKFLFDGQSLSGFEIGGGMIGSWVPGTNGDGGDVLTCLSSHGEIALPIPCGSNNNPFRLAVFIEANGGVPSNEATMDLEFDLVANDSIQRYSVRCRPGSAEIIRKDGRSGGSETKVGESVSVDLTSRPHVIHVERQIDGWFVFLEENILATLPRLNLQNPDQEKARVRFVIDQPNVQDQTTAFYISDIQCMSLEPPNSK